MTSGPHITTSVLSDLFPTVDRGAMAPLDRPPPRLGRSIDSDLNFDTLLFPGIDFITIENQIGRTRSIQQRRFDQNRDDSR